MLSPSSFIDPSALTLVIVANSTPVIVSWLMGPRLSAPIDAGARLPDGKPVFGPHKTWRGLVAGLAASTLAGAALPCGAAVGALFGALSLAGDLCSSFVKRRLNRPSGSDMPLLDQLPESLLPLLVLRHELDLSLAGIVGTVVIFTLADLMITKVRARVSDAASVEDSA